MDPSSRPMEGPWKGESKIVVGIDIGTTDSGVSFACLQQGYNQTVHRVTQWPGQGTQQQLSRIPTLVWYDREKKAVSFGAEALSDQAEEMAEDNDWMLAKCFPFHLYPYGMIAKRGLCLDPLPLGVSLQQIYSDFLHYLIQHTKSYFEDRMIDGKQLWNQLEPKMEVVITCPSGWGIQERAFLRSAFVTAGIADVAASVQILFVTQLEAMANFFCYQTDNGFFQPAKDLMICDAGGSIVEATIFSVIDTQPTLKLKEHSSACTQAGGIFVDAEAERYIRNMLGNAGLSHEDIEEYTARGVKDFMLDTKRSFCDAAVDCTIEISGTRFNNPSIRTRRGRMVLPGAIVRTFFDASINQIILSLDNLLQVSTTKDIILTGEFGESLFLQKMLKERYEPKGYKVIPTNDSAYNIVADGAVTWGTVNHSCGHALRFSYGFVVSTIFDPESNEHQGRETYVSSRGDEKVIGAWSQLVNKGDIVNQDEVTRVPFNRIFTSSTAPLSTFRADLFAYTKEGSPPFARDPQGRLLDGFRKICTMTADLSNLRGALQEISAPGRSYWNLTYELCLRFGGVELGASIEWQENGIICAVPVKIKPVEVVYLD